MAIEIDGSLLHDGANSLQREGSGLLAILVIIPVSRTSAGPVTMLKLDLCMLSASSNSCHLVSAGSQQLLPLL